MRLDKQQQGDDNESGWTGGMHKERHCPLCTTLNEDFLFCAEEILQATVDNFVQAATGRLEKCDDAISRVGLAAAARPYHQL